MKKNENIIKTNFLIIKLSNPKGVAQNFEENQHFCYTYARENISNELFESFEINGDDDEFAKTLKEENPLKEYLLLLNMDRIGTKTTNLYLTN